MKDEVRISLVQFGSRTLEPEHNAERMAAFVTAEAREHAADIVVFPELSNTGYVRSIRDGDYARRLHAASETIPGPTSDRLCAAAREAKTHVAVGISQRHPRIGELLYNTALLIGPSGEILGTQHKIHAWRDEKEYFALGDTIATFSTDLGCVGLELCYDVRFPEVARIQLLDGAEIIVSLWAAAVQPGHVPDDSIISRCATRAMENALYFAGCNRTGRDGDLEFFGHSAIAAPDGTTLAASRSADEEVVRATLTAERLAAQRRYLTILRDRRPEMYGRITTSMSDLAADRPRTARK